MESERSKRELESPSPSDLAPSEEHPRARRRLRSSEDGCERIVISDADASFILGTGGRTKRKLARVARCELNVTQKGDQTVLEMIANEEAIERARTYIGFVMQQRVGPVRLGPETRERDDLVILDIPHECVGYVTGHKGQGLRAVEEEFATLMFFTDVDKERPPAQAPETEKLVIFSPCQRARQGAVLKVMSAIEQKRPGHFTTEVKEKINEDEEFNVDITPVADDDYSYALGKGGATRKKLARASGAILEYIGKFAFIAGEKSQRERGRQYLKWLCAQRTAPNKGAGESAYPRDRDDLTTMNVPMDCVAYVTGHRGQALRKIEEATGTFMFLDGTRGDVSETLYIFGESSSGRHRAKELARLRIEEKQNGVPTQGGNRSNYEYRYERRREEVYPRRRSGPYGRASVSPGRRCRSPVRCRSPGGRRDGEDRYRGSSWNRRESFDREGGWARRYVDSGEGDYRGSEAGNYRRREQSDYRRYDRERSSRY